MQSWDEAAATVAVRNVGGIDACSVTLDPGVTALTGRNATNRTSLLRALTDALGGSAGRLKRDADTGVAELSVGGDSCRVEYERRGGDTVRSGTPYADERALVDNFASLLADNPARRAVETGGDLRPVIMAPVDTEDLAAEIASNTEQRRDIEEQLASLDHRLDRLPGLRERRATLEDDLAEVEDDIAATREAIERDRVDADLVAAAEAVLDDLETARERRERLRDRRAVQRRSVAALTDERDALESELAELAVDDERLAAVGSRVEELQARERSLAEAATELATVAEFNADRLADGVPGALEEGDADTVDCWTCGSTVATDRITQRLDAVREMAAERRAERDAVADRLADLRDEREELREAAERRDELERRLEAVDDRVARRRERVAALGDDVDALTTEIDRIETQLETIEVDDRDVVERYRSLTDLEYRRGSVEAELADVTDEIEALTDLEAERDELCDRRETIAAEIESLRARIEETEREAVDTFNERMDELLAVLGYERVTRVWVERQVDDGGGASSFDLHVVRRGDDGRVYEDSVGTLSESERTVVGLVVALAGYLVHEVHETAPFLLLDSVEPLDSDRIAALVDYLDEYAEFLVVALLPADAAALDDRHDRLPAAEIGS